MMGRCLGENYRTIKAMETEHEKALFPLAENILSYDEKEELKRLLQIDSASSPT